MDPSSITGPRYFCAACNAGLTDDEMDDGLAVRRGTEVLCHKCFRKKYPGECINHPGSKATRRCSVCRRRLCENCLIKLQGRRVCGRCKERVLGELADGRPRVFTSKILASFDRPSYRQSTVAIFIAGLLGFICCGLLGILAVTGYMRHRREVARGWARRSILADIGFYLGVGWLIFFVTLCILSIVIDRFP